MVDASELVRATTLTFTSADGRRKHTWQAQPADKVKDFGVVPDRMFASRVLWLRGGASWLVLIAEQSTRQLWAVTGTPDAPQKARWIDLGKTSDATGGFFFHFSAYDMCDALANLDDDEMVGINASNKLWRFSFRLSQGKASRRETPIPFVDQREYPELRLSPRTGRLAVLSGPWTGVSERDLSLYTMRLDGTERVCLGTVKVDECRRIHGFQWLPSGKSLSFWYNDELRFIDDASPKPTQPARRLV